MAKQGSENVVCLIDKDHKKVGTVIGSKCVCGIEKLAELNFSEKLFLIVTRQENYPVCMELCSLIDINYICYLNEELEVHSLAEYKAIYHTWASLRKNLQLDLFHDTETSLPVSCVRKKIRFFLNAIVNAYNAIKTLAEEYAIDDTCEVVIIFPSENKPFYEKYAPLLKKT